MSYLTYEMQEQMIAEKMKLKREKETERWAKEQKKIVLEEVKLSQRDMSKLYTKKEINAIKKADVKDIKNELNESRIRQLKAAKEQFEKSVKYYKNEIVERKTEYNKTKKRLSKIDTEHLEFMMKELKEKWEKQWGNKKSPKGTRKNK